MHGIARTAGAAWFTREVGWPVGDSVFMTSAFPSDPCLTISSFTCDVYGFVSCFSSSLPSTFPHSLKSPVLEIENILYYRMWVFGCFVCLFINDCTFTVEKKYKKH